MKQEGVQYSTKVRLCDNRHFSINYVAFVALLQKIFSWRTNKIFWWQVRQWSHLVDEMSRRLLMATQKDLLNWCVHKRVR